MAAQATSVFRGRAVQQHEPGIKVADFDQLVPIMSRHGTSFDIDIDIDIAVTEAEAVDAARALPLQVIPSDVRLLEGTGQSAS